MTDMSATRGGPRSEPLIARVTRNRTIIVPLGMLVLMLALLQVVSPAPLGYFDISTISASATALALAAVGATVVIIAGGLDLSAGAVVSLVNVVLVTQLGTAYIGPIEYSVLAMMLSLGLGAAIGALNGALVGYARMQSIIVSLATMFIAQGAALLVLKYPGGEFSYDFSMLLVGDAIPGLLPAPLVVVLIALLVWNYLKSTRLGVALYAVGSDEGAATSNGVNSPATKFWSFTVAGAFYGAAGLFVTANSGSGDPLIGASMLLKVFASVVLGGTIIGGGRGGAGGRGIGAFVLTILVNVFLALGIRTYYVPIVEGLVLIAAVLGFSRFRDLPIWSLAARLSAPALKRGFSPNRGAKPTLQAATVLPSWFDNNARVLRYIAPAWALLILIVAATGILVGPGFSLANHVQSVLLFGSFLAILGLGQGAVIMAGGLDLSVAWTITFPAIVLTTYANGSNIVAAWALPLALLLGALIGLANGLLVVGFGISPIIATLAMGSILEGSALVFSAGAPTGEAPAAVVWLVNGRFLGIPPIIWFL